MQEQEKMDAGHAAMAALNLWIGPAQMAVVRYCMGGQERLYYAEKMVELLASVQAVPGLYWHEEQGEESMARLHYFRGSTDYYVSEFDPDEGVCFGYSIIGGDHWCAELGYMHLAELLQAGLELDFHYKPELLSDVVARSKARV